MYISENYIKYLQSLTITEIKDKVVISLIVKDYFKHQNDIGNHITNREYEIMYYLIRSGNPRSYLDNAYHYNTRGDKFVFEYVNSIITENGIILTLMSTCDICMQRNNQTYYDFYLPKTHIYEDRKSLVFCKLHIENIINFAENVIVSMYNDLFFKYMLFTYLHIDVRNYIFNMVL